MSNFKIGTKCIQAGYTPKNGEARVLPIYQSTTFKYENSDEMIRLIDSYEKSMKENIRKAEHVELLEKLQFQAAA